MELLDTISLKSGAVEKRIELLQGDLSRIPPEYAVDVLVVSALPDSYVPTSRSLIGALDRAGLSVADLARDKDTDLRHAFSCWLSREISGRSSVLGFKRVLCFEPLPKGDPPELVGDVFRALAPFLGARPPLAKVATPLLATGDQRFPVSLVLPPLLEAAAHWMSIGLPLEVLRIVASSDRKANEARMYFTQFRNRLRLPSRLGDRSHEYEIFISYARRESDPAVLLAETLRERGARVFVDRQAIDVGASWQHHIFSAIDQCKRVVCLYSPSYVTSKVCQEEFNIAWARGRDEARDVLFPIYWRTADLPTYMRMLDYVDCREGETEKLLAAAHSILVRL